MSKKNKKKSLYINSNKNQYIFNNVTLNMNVSLIDFCYKIKEIAGDNQILINTPDYYFANAILDWEIKKYENHRISLLLLLQYIEMPTPIYITLLLQKKHKFSLTERTDFFNSIDCDKRFVHEYYLLINNFINTTKGSKTTYVSTFLKLISKKQNEYNLNDDSLLYFYEYFHDILVKKNEYFELERLTDKITNKLESVKSQSLCFFLAYFAYDKNADKAIEYAYEFLNLDKYSNDSYLTSITSNTLNLIIKENLWEHYDFWIEKLSSLVGSDDERILNYQKKFDEAQLKFKNRIEYPLNPTNVKSISIETISTSDLVFLLALFKECSTDWGFLVNATNIKYVFPSYEIGYALVKQLLDRKIIKLSSSDFQKLDDEDLYSAKMMINNCRMHLNIDHIIDVKSISTKLIKEEILRRNDLNESILEIWKLIVLGYFYSSLEYNLSVIKDTWTQEFKLNSSTMERLENINSNARRLSFIAYSSVKSTAGSHSLNETMGNKHTRNLLINNINRQLDYIENCGADYSKTRYSKAPILAIEKIIEDISEIDPITLYDEIPSLSFIDKNDF